MQQVSTLALLGALATVSLAGTLPRGVGPEFASHYENALAHDLGLEWRCINHPEIRIPTTYINDGTCHCPDGSDEPGTAACAYLDTASPAQPLPGSSSGTTKTKNALPGFWCENKGHIGAYVPFSYVNDGVCDYDICCDGTEEFGGKAKCENKCASLGKEFRKLAKEKKAKMERAGAKRMQMAKEADTLRHQLEEKIAGLRAEVSVLEKKKDELWKKHAEVELEEKNKVVKSSGSSGSAGGKLGVLLGLAKTRVEELRITLGNVMQQRDDLAGKVIELETILSKFKEEYNPNFNDEGVKAAVKAYEDYAAREADAREHIPDSEVFEVLKEDSEVSGVNWAEFEGGEGDDTDILYSFEAYLPAFVRGAIHEKLGQLRLWLIANGMLADNVKEGTESTLLKAARKDAEAAEKDVKSKKKELTKQEDDLGMDYGPGDIFRAARNKCISVDAGEYTYELCWLGKTMQKSKKGHGSTSMGNYRRIEFHDADDEERLDGKSLGQGRRMVMKYEDGQQCWNGPKRRTDVWLGCAETEEVWRVSESEKCVYKMEVGTPAACEAEGQPNKADGKDEL